MNTATVEQQIIDALTGNLDSYSLLDLVEQTKTAITVSENDAKIARAAALDPLQSPDPVKARATMEDAEFRSARLKSLLPKLQTRASNVAKREQYTSWCERFDPLVPKVNDAAAKLTTLYQNFVAQAVPLFAEIEKIDAEVASVSRDKPYHTNDGRSLRAIEMTARGIDNFGLYGIKILEIKLPSWDHPDKLAWPPHRPIDWSGVVPVRPHPGNMWWKAKDEEHAAKTAEAEAANAEYRKGEAERREAVHRPRGIVSY
jgi:hypothetical protein